MKILNKANATYIEQAKPDEVDIDILTAGTHGSGVYTDVRGRAGLEIRAQSSPDMTVQATPGSASVEGTPLLGNTGDASITIAAAHSTLNRRDLITISSNGTFEAVTGTAAENPTLPSIPSEEIVLAVVDVRAGATQINSTDITDKRAQITWDEFNVRRYAASGSRFIGTGSISASSAALTFDQAHDYVEGQGIVLLRAGANPTISAPATAPAITVNGTPGATTYQYAVCYGDGLGGWTAPHVGSSIANGPATLDGTDNLTVKIYIPTGCRAIAIYGRGTSGRTIQVVLPAARDGSDGGGDFKNWTDQGDTLDYVHHTWAHRTSFVYKRGDVVVGNGELWRCWLAKADRLSNVSAPGFTEGLNIDVRDGGGANSADIIWRREDGVVPVNEPAGVIPRWLRTLVLSVESRTSLTLSVAATNTTSSVAIYHDDAQAFKDCLSTYNDANSSSTRYIVPGGFYQLLMGSEIDPMLELNDSKYGLLFVDDQDAGGNNDSTNNRTLDLWASSSAVIRTLTAAVPGKKNADSNPYEISLWQFAKFSQNVRMDGGQWWLDGFGSGWMDDDTATSSISGWSFETSVTFGARRNWYWENMTFDNFPRIGRDSGVTFDDGTSESEWTLLNCKIVNYGGADGDEAFFVHGGFDFIGGLVQSHHRFQSHGFYLNTDKHRCRIASTTFIRAGNTSNKNAIQMRGASGADQRERIVSNNFFRDSGRLLLGDSTESPGIFDVTVTGNTFVNCDQTSLAEARRVTFASNVWRDTDTRITEDCHDITFSACNWIDSVVTAGSSTAKDTNIAFQGGNVRITAGSLITTPWLKVDQDLDHLIVNGMNVIDDRDFSTEGAVGGAFIELSTPINGVTISNCNVKHTGDGGSNNPGTGVVIFSGNSKTVNGLLISNNTMDWAGTNYNSSDGLMFCQMGPTTGMTTDVMRILNNHIELANGSFRRPFEINLTAGRLVFDGNSDSRTSFNNGGWEFGGSAGNTVIRNCRTVNIKVTGGIEYGKGNVLDGLLDTNDLGNRNTNFTPDNLFRRYTMTLTGAVTVLALEAGQDGAELTIQYTQDATGSHAFTFTTGVAGGFLVSGADTTTASTTTVRTFRYDASLARWVQTSFETGL